MRPYFVKIFGILLGAIFVALGYLWFPTHPPVKSIDLKAPITTTFTGQFMATRAGSGVVPNDPVLFMDGKEQPLRTAISRKWTVLNLWATWCAPCVAELPSLAALQTHYAGRLNVLALSFDNNTDISKLSQFMTKHKVSGLAFAYDHQLKVRTAIETNGLPTSLIIDPNGKIIMILEGHIDWTSDKALAFFDEIVTKS